MPARNELAAGFEDMPGPIYKSSKAFLRIDAVELIQDLGLCYCLLE
jgi:hypothetical protein